METTESITLTEQEESFLRKFRKLNADQQEVIDLLICTYKHAYDKQIDISTYQEKIDILMREFKESGDNTEIVEYLVTLILDFRSRAA